MKLKSEAMYSSEKASPFLFFRRFLASPKTVGALCPSSRFLAKAIVTEAKKYLSDDEYILELGPGGGSFTKEMLAQGISAERIFCIEMDTHLAEQMVSRFPKITVIQGNACSLSSLCPHHIKGRVGAVISGLPMLNISLIAQQRIVEESFSLLKKGGRFLQFTYGYQSSLKAESLDLSSTLVKRVFLNIPPASVWAYTKRSPF